MSSAVSTFKKGRVYRALIDSKCLLFFDKLKNEDINTLMFVLERDINKGIRGEESSDFKNLMVNIDKPQDAPTVVSEVSVLLFALRESLALACQMLFSSVDGANPEMGLTVLNNDNIISIENEESNIYSIVYKVLVQDILFDECGDILLLNCDDRYGCHTHEFGEIISTTINFSGEFGQTTKFTFAAVDDELNRIFNLTNHILQAGLPVFQVDSQGMAQPQSE